MTAKAKKVRKKKEKITHSLAAVGKGVPRKFCPINELDIFKHLVPAAVTGVASPPGQNCSKSPQ